MKSNLLSNVMKMAARKKTFNERLKYMIQGIIFMPFLMRDLAKTNKDNSSTSLSASGDDVYPLF